MLTRQELEKKALEEAALARAALNEAPSTPGSEYIRLQAEAQHRVAAVHAQLAQMYASLFIGSR